MFKTASSYYKFSTEMNGAYQTCLDRAYKHELKKNTIKGKW